MLSLLHFTAPVNGSVNIYRQFSLVARFDHPTIVLARACRQVFFTFTSLLTQGCEIVGFFMVIPAGVFFQNLRDSLGDEKNLRDSLGDENFGW